MNRFCAASTLPKEEEKLLCDPAVDVGACQVSVKVRSESHWEFTIT